MSVISDTVARDISRALRPLKNRMHVNRMIHIVAYGIIAAGAVSLAVSVASLLMPVPFLGTIILSVYAASLIVSLVVSLFAGPNIFQTIRTADSMGLKERLITAYELREHDDPLSQVQRQDALKSVSQVDFKSLYRIIMPKLQYLIGAVLVVLVALSFIMPSVSRQRASKIEDFLKEKAKQIEEIDRQREELNKESGISPQKLEELNKRIDELLKELRRSDDEEEAIKALAKARHELENLKSMDRPSELTKAGDSLMDNPLTSQLGQAMKEGSLEEIKQKLEQLKQKLESLDENERKQAEESLNKAANAASGNAELEQSLSELAKAAGSGNSDSISSGVSNLSSALADAMDSFSGSADGSAEQSNKAIDNMIASISEARQQISRQAGQNSGQAQEGQNGGNNTDGNGQNTGQGGQNQDGDSQSNGQGQGNGQGNQGQDGNGQSQGNGQGNGQGQGQGNGQGNGQGGGFSDGGAGNSSSDGDAGYTGQESGGGSRDPGEKQVKEYESIYVPSRIGGDGDASYIKGSKGDSGQSQWSEVEGVPVDKGGAVPYSSVLGDYKHEAMLRLNNSTIPPGMKDIVREYFSSLE